MFAYCNNNSINMLDITGQYPIFVVTGIDTEKDEKEDTIYYKTTIYFYIANTDDPHSSLEQATNQQSSVFEYSLSAGQIHFENCQNAATLLISPNISHSLAREIHSQVVSIDPALMKKRTVVGIQFELIAHFAGSALGIKRQNTAVTDIGNNVPGSYGYDYNADWFENPLGNIGTIFKKLLG